MSKIFVKRKIDVTLQLGQGRVFTETQSSTIKVTGLRVAASIESAGMTDSQAHIQIWGLTRSQMQQMSTLGLRYGIQIENKIKLEAGDDENGMSLAFSGALNDGYIDARGSPAVSFQIAAVNNYFGNVQAVPPTSLNSPVNVAQAMQQFAKQMGLQFRNNGVDVTLPHSYLSGSLGEQAKTLADHANIIYLIDRDTMIISPRAGSKRGPVIPLISASTGLIGYPTLTSYQVEFTCVWLPQLYCQDFIQLQTDLRSEPGVWRVTKMVHELSSETTGGPWYSNVTATSETLRPGTGTPS